IASGKPVSLNPSTTTNSAAKNTSKCQSTSLSTSCVSRRARTITSAAPASAVHARFSPTTKPAKIDTNTMQTIANKPLSKLRDGVRSSLDHRLPQDFSKTKTQDCEIDRQSDNRHRHQRPGKLRKRNVREMPNNHVLRITHQRGHAADVRAGGERDKIRQQWQLSATDDGDNKWRQHQADRVVDEQGRENSRREYEIQQQPLWSAGESQDNVSGSFEKMCEIKICGDEHHREQQHDRVVVHRAIGALGRHHPR